MAMGPADAGEFWRRLILQRAEASWGNFAWFSPKTLLLSINDQVVKHIEEPGANGGSIVDRRRMRWREAQRAKGIGDDLSITVRDRGLLLLGDPGEMDASQYVLIRDLSAQRETFRERGINTALLMSDVVYPAGSVNQWPDAVYLPYLGLPRAAWDRAVEDWPRGSHLEPPLLGWNVLAMPGNHDWYDGLNGFMYHACGSEPLPEVSYDDSGFTWRQRLARRWWRNPSPPRRESIQILRAELTGSRPSEAERIPAHPVGEGIPALPGPYYMVNFAPGDEVLFRLIVVDTGITGTVDREQADWLQTTALSGDMPKILVTGVPVAVDNAVSRLRVPPATGVEAGPKVTPRLVPAERPTHLAELIGPEHRVVASIAGDTHNYQRMIFGQTPEGAWPIPVNIVSGGAGAYLSQAHSVRLTETDGLEVSVREVATRSQALEVPRSDHTRFPSREVSALHFARQRRDYAGLVCGLAAVGAGALWWWIVAVDSFLNRSLSPQEQSLGLAEVSRSMTVLVPFGLAALGGLAVVVRRSRRRDPPPPTEPAGRASSLPRLAWLAVLLAGISALVWWLVGDVSAASRLRSGGAGLAWLERDLRIVIASSVFCVLFVGFQVLPPLVESFPDLRRSWIPKVLLVVVLFVYFTSYQQSVALTLSSVAAATVVFMTLTTAYRATMRELTARRLRRPREVSTWLLRGMLRWVPFLGTLGVVLLATVIEPEKTVLILRGGSRAAFLGEAGRCLALGTCLLLLVGAGGGLVLPSMWRDRAWRAMPHLARAAVVLAAVGAGLGVAAVLGHRLPLPVVVVGVAFAGALAALIVVGLTLAAAGRRRARLDDVRAALRARDGYGSVDPSLALFASMMVAGVPKVDAMAEVPDAPFAKNVLLLTHEVGEHGPALTFEAWGLNDESRETTPSAPTWSTRPEGEEHGFFIIDRLSWPVPR